MSIMDTQAYLLRIGYTGPATPSAETLRALHRAHLFTVPFENLDIGLGRNIACDESAAVRKVVDLKRGGFCYELNSAFASLLRALGFKVTLLSARVARADGSSSPEFDHLTLRVDLEEPWLADVGFGDSFLNPLRLKTGIEQEEGSRKYRLTGKDDTIHLERTEPDGKWTSQYSFTQTPRKLSEFARMCHYHQTSPESHFTQNRICTKATPAGRITLSARKLIETNNGIRTERELGSEEEWKAALQQNFGIAF
jgi:N-hydroxyarylamine O-acetyltransferase